MPGKWFFSYGFELNSWISSWMNEWMNWMNWIHLFCHSHLPTKELEIILHDMTIIDSSSSPQPSDHVHTFHLRKREMSSSAKDDSRSSFDKLRSNFMRTSKSDEVKNVNTVKSVESQSSPTRCPAESSGLSNYQPLENLSKLVDSAPSMKEVTKFRSEGLSKWNSTHCDLEGAKISKSCKPSPSRSTPTSEHKTSLETTKESHDEKRQKKRKVFSIADILDPHFGSKSSNDSKRTRFDHPEPTRTPYLQNSLPVPFPVMNPIVCGMLEQHTGAYFWNFCQTNSSPNHLYPKLEKENPSMCNNNNNGFNNYLPIPLHQNLFYHHPSMTSYHLPYAMSLRRVKPPTPPLETFSSSGDTRSQQESLKLILANKDKGSTFSGSADTGEYHNNHRALPSSSPPPPPPPLPTTTSRPHNKSGDRTPGITTESPRSTTSQPLDKTSEQNRSQMSQKLWPAWVYCTRYSDRPSSGKVINFELRIFS